MTISEGASPDLAIEVSRMPAEQVEVFDSTASFEEEMEAMNIGELQAELEAMRAEMETELTGEPVRFDRS